VKSRSESYWAGGEQICLDLSTFGQIYYNSASFSAYYSVLGLSLTFTYGIFTQHHAGRESEVHKQELKHMEAADTNLFLVQVANIVLGKLTRLIVAGKD
jgi:hypothetical protein